MLTPTGCCTGILGGERFGKRRYLKEERMSLAKRIDLNVPYSEQEDAKALGGRSHLHKKRWYAPPGTNLDHLKRWLPDVLDVFPAGEPAHEAENGTEKGVSLRELLTRVKGVIERGLPDAVWVRAEINELRGKNGHLYPTL